MRAVLHVHPPFATAYAVAEEKIPMVTDAAEIILGEIPLLQYAPPGSLELAAKVKNGLKDMEVKAVLLRKHGIVAVGEDLEKAYQIAAWIEDTAKIAFLSSLIKSSKETGPSKATRT